MLEVLSLARRAAPSDATVLIRGESGTGKELIARGYSLCQLSDIGPADPGELCSSPETLLESELFGHGHGAFTGALATRKGASS